MAKENGVVADESQGTPLGARAPFTQDNFLETLRANMPARENENDGDGDGDTDQDDDGGDGEPGKRKGKAKKPKNLEAAAEALGLSVAELYGLEVPSARQGEKPYTLGSLKDLAAQQDDYSERTLRLDSDRRAFERERVTATTEIREMMSALPEDALKPEALKKLRAGIETKHARERALMVEHIPEWVDETVRRNDLRAMVEHLKSYGLPETTLMEHFDHRLMRFVRDAMRIQQAVDKALGQVKERKGKTPGTGQARGTERTGNKSPQKSGGARETRQVRGFLHTIAAAAAKT